ESVVADLPRHEVLRDDTHRLAARPQYGVRDHTHQAHIAAAVHQSNVPSYQFRTHLLGGSAVLRTATLTGAAENANSFHTIILNFGLAKGRSLRSAGDLIYSPDRLAVSGRFSNS